VQSPLRLSVASQLFVHSLGAQTGTPQPIAKGICLQMGGFLPRTTVYQTALFRAATGTLPVPE
jgi:hypothetical protein